MRNIASALQAFFRGFGADAYGKNNVPQAARMPYITYDTGAPCGDEPLERRAWLWCRGPGRDAAAALVDAVRASLDEGGAALPGAVILPGAPFAVEEPGAAGDVLCVTMRLQVLAEG